MGTVTIGGTNHTIFGTHTGPSTPLAANDYLAASLQYAASWSAASAGDTQKIALVSAARAFDRLKWKNLTGSPSVAASWPSSTIPDAVIFASYELAAHVLTDKSFLGTPGGQSARVQTVQSKGVGVTFFSTPKDAGRFPSHIMELIRDYLSAGMSTSTATVTGLDGEPALVEDDDTLEVTGGL